MPVDNFPRVIKEILKTEGGAKFTNRPTDKGGPTKFGISQKAYPHMSESEIRNLTQEQAEHLYFQDYWKKSNIDKVFDFDNAHMIMDTVVNQGNGGGGILIQKALNDLGAGLKVDGGIGTATINAINTRNPKAFRDTLYLFRKARYEELAKADPKYGTPNLKGWLARIDRFKGGVIGGGLLFAAAAGAAIYYYLRRGRIT